MNKGAFEFELWVKKAKEGSKEGINKKNVKINNKYEALSNDEMDEDDEDVQMLDMVFRWQEA